MLDCSWELHSENPVSVYFSRLVGCGRILAQMCFGMLYIATK